MRKLTESLENLVSLLFPKSRTSGAKYKETGLFDDIWYARTYLGDETKKSLSWSHFLKIGSSLGYDPSVFSTQTGTYGQTLKLLIQARILFYISLRLVGNKGLIQIHNSA